MHETVYLRSKFIVNHLLDSYLIEPIQRTMRYPLLLSSLRKEVSKSDLPESDSLLQKLDSTIQKVEAAAGVINELQDSAERLIISREETVVRATVRRKPGVAMRRERIYRSNDHNFVSHFFNQPTFCAHCTDFIWGLGVVINTLLYRLLGGHRTGRYICESI